MKKMRKGPPAHLTVNPELREQGEKARADFRNAVENIPEEERDELKQVVELRLFILQQIERNGLRRKTIADRMGIREEAVSRLLNHEIFNPTLSTLTKLMVAVTGTKMSVTEIFKAGLSKAKGDERPQVLLVQNLSTVTRTKSIKRSSSRIARMGGFSKNYNSATVKTHLLKNVSF